MKLVGKVDKITADRTNYKQYSPNLSFEDLFVEFEVPDEGVVYSDVDGVTLSASGFTALLDAVARTADEANKIQMKRIQRGDL